MHSSDIELIQVVATGNHAVQLKWYKYVDFSYLYVIYLTLILLMWRIG